SGLSSFIVFLNNTHKSSPPAAAPTFRSAQDLYPSLTNQGLTIQIDDKHYHSLEMDQVPP
ncbi:hypothetical protein, partial [Pseudomonas koreensis]|uniref:hypothetical protein n=1 Tax=Pseudomonas koreensis TaxID=198620 RepID=UPI003208115E